MSKDTWEAIKSQEPNYSAYQSLLEQRRRRNAEDNLNKERQAQIANEASARAAAKEKMATSGRRAGQSTRQDFSTFQPASAVSAGDNLIGRGNLFGN